MKKDIILEAEFFLSSFFWGVFLLFLYDCIQIARNLKHHTWLAVALEDILFWGTAGIFVFHMVYERNNGIIRAYAGGAMFLGMWFYHILISTWYVGLCVSVIKKAGKVVAKLIYQLTTPFRFVYDKIQKKLERTGLFFQKRIKKVKNKCKERVQVIHNGYKIKSGIKKQKKLEVKRKRQEEKKRLKEEQGHDGIEKKQERGILERIT